MKSRQLFNIAEHGFEQHPQFLQPSLLAAIIEALQQLASEHRTHGLRNAEKKLPAINTLIHSRHLLELAADYLSGTPQVVRVIVFDKTAAKNWLVSWHQDKTVAVSRRVDIPGWGPWTVKDGQHHVQPDIEVLNNMITFRLHLDDTDENNGCLKVIPASHQLGILSKTEIDKAVQRTEPFICSARSGDLLLMRPHLLHASSKAHIPRHRRIIHIEYSSYCLPAGLAWA